MGILKRAHNGDYYFFKKRNEFINKQTAEIMSKCKNCGIYKEKFEDRYAKDKKYLKARDHCHYTRKHRGAAYSIHNLKQLVPN